MELSYPKINDCAAKAFEAESINALCLYPIDSVEHIKRYESIRPFIIKTLLFVGIIPGDGSYGIIARLLETLALHPETDFNMLISDFSKRLGKTPSSLLYIVEKNFNVYNDALFNKLTFLTKTKPVAYRDMLYDLAQYVRAKYYYGEEYA